MFSEFEIAADLRVVPESTGGESTAWRQLLPALGSGSKSFCKGFANALGLAMVAVPAALCRIEASLTERMELFRFWGQTFALVPGILGNYLRRCFYRLTLEECSRSCEIGFLSRIVHRSTEVGERVYIGAGATIGVASLGNGCLIGSRASLINGGWQHSFGADGKLTACDNGSLTPIRIGEETWIGEAAVLMADVGNRCIVAAGSVVSSPVPDGRIVGGNPARFVARIDQPSPGSLRSSAHRIFTHG